MACTKCFPSRKTFLHFNNSPCYLRNFAHIGWVAPVIALTVRAVNEHVISIHCSSAEDFWDCNVVMGSSLYFFTIFWCWFFSSVMASDKNGGEWPSSVHSSVFIIISSNFAWAARPAVVGIFSDSVLSIFRVPASFVFTKMQFACWQLQLSLLLWAYEQWVVQ